MSGEMNSAFETDLNEIIAEYLEYHNLNSTKLNFIAELNEKGKPTPKSEKKSSFIEANELENEFFNAFEKGNKHEFFQLWNSKLSAKLRNEDSVCQKLEFYCQIYFAIYTIKHDIQDKATETLAMQGFREYLETKGRKVSTNQEFVQYYALPYVTNPQDHPSFSELFHSSWVPGLEMRLKRFFQLVLSKKAEPTLIALYKKQSNDHDDNSLKILQAKVVESERRASQYYKKLNQVQVNFHSLLGITAELIDLLEGSLQGIPISPNHLKNVCQKIFVSQNQRTTSNGMPMETSIDLSRPGTASKLLLQSIQVSNGSLANHQKLAFEPVLLHTPIKTKPLNFTKIKFDLDHGHLRIKVLLLQAFRWRLTKTDVETRDKFISGITQHDLLGIEPGEYHDAIFRMMNSSSGSEELQEYLARFINAIATLCRGRSYLVKSLAICELLFLNILNLVHHESIFRENLIGALQKLSLRRYIQTYMISNGMIEWLLVLLEENSSLSDYTLDYSVALLMNLCLRSSGKKRCVEQKEKVIRVLSKMLDSFNKEIASYVNGALYSILGMPEIREEAIKMDLEAVLRNHMSPDHPDMNRQFEYIINQLKSNDEPKAEESDDEEEDDDEEDPEVLESELDKEESAISGDDELSGENLLNANYTLQSGFSRMSQDFVSGNPTINRPVTPGTFLARHTPLINEFDSARPPTRSGSATQQDPAGTAATENDKSHLLKPDVIKDNPNYKKAFSSRPKIPRTPDEDSGKRNSLQSLTGPIQSSGRLPTPSNSNGTRRGKESMSAIK